MGNVKKLGRVGIKTLVYFEVITTIAIILGLLIANIFHPGTFVDLKSLQAGDISAYVKSAKSYNSGGGIWGTVMDMVPTNIFSSLSTGDIMPIILFCILFGFGTASSVKKDRSSSTF